MGLLVFLLLTKLRESWVIPAQRKHQGLYREMYESLQELIKGAEDIRMLEQGAWADARLAARCDSLKTAAVDYHKRSGSIAFISSCNTWILPCTAVLLAFIKLCDGSLSVGSCLVVIQFSNLLNSQFQSIHQNANYLMDFVPHLSQIADSFSGHRQHGQHHQRDNLPQNVLLCAKGLSIGFTNRPLFTGVSLEAKRGEILEIRGESGCGKSTLLKILWGSCSPDDGTVTLQKNCRVGTLQQDFYLFQRSLGDNLRIAKPNATPKEMEEALEKAGLGEYLKGLPKGLNTQLGEGGSAMSGGQRAKLGLARIMLQDADLILLDEPLTNIDLHTRKEILVGLQKFLKNKACLLVTHEPEVSSIATKTLDLKELSQGINCARIGELL